MPIALAKTKEGYWVADAMNGLMLFDSASSRFTRAVPLPHVALQDMIALNDTTLIVAGPNEALIDSKVSWLRAIDSRTGGERWRAMSPRVRLPQRIVNSYSRVRIATHLGTIVATNSVIDTLFLIDWRSGTLIKAHPMNLRLSVPRALAKATSRLRSEELRDLTRVSTVAMIDENRFVADVATGSGQQIQFTRSLGDLRTSSPPEVFAAMETILDARDGVFVTQSVDANKRNHVKVLWGKR